MPAAQAPEEEPDDLSQEENWELQDAAAAEREAAEYGDYVDGMQLERETTETQMESATVEALPESLELIPPPPSAPENEARDGETEAVFSAEPTSDDTASATSGEIAEQP